ncbi:MAG: glycosyltransferase family A protein [Bacteroidota bacterium]
MKCYIVIPAHNEEAFLRHMLNSIVTQSLLPEKVVVVNDNSTDSTAAIIDEFTAKYHFFHNVNTASSPDHLPGSKIIAAFYKGFKMLDDHYDIIIKLDADIVLPEKYLESIATIFKTFPRVGIAGGFIYEKDKHNTWILNHPMNHNHVRGAFKAYTKACFTAIGGLKPSMGWDTVDELLARYHGFETYTNKALKVKHLRPTGTSYHKKAKLMHGEAMYKMRYGVLLTAIAAAKIAWKQKRLRTFLHHLQGYYTARKKNLPFLVSKAEGTFIRKYRWKGILKKLL